MKGKKGVSPLIATVLVIGFTIVLAALVMQWGGGLFKQVQEETGETSEVKIACSTKLVGLDVSASRAAGLVVTVDNKNDYDNIDGALIRLYDASGKAVGVGDFVAGSEDEVGCAEGDCTIGAFETNDYTMPVDDPSATDVGVFPRINIKGKSKICENEFKSVIG